MTTTRLIKHGNDQAAIVLAEFAFAEDDVELEIMRSGDMLMIYPRRMKKSAKEAAAALRALPRSTEVENREPTELPQRQE
ncbi:MAG: AbrB/MazE/SpoVT family DNA-binding domain-containing protein [Micropepsaceae bacterium]